MKLRINVTKKILWESRNADYCDTEECALAHSVRDIFPDAQVTQENIYLFNATEKIPLPKECFQYVCNFDNATPVERPNLPELSFEIDIPQSVIDKINIDEIRPLLVNHATLTLINN